MTAPLTNEYRPFSLAVIGFAGGAACGCDFSCPRTAPENAVNTANIKQNLFFTSHLSERSCHISEWGGREKPAPSTEIDSINEPAEHPDIKRRPKNPALLVDN